jgi:hypothetical protein
MPDAQTTMPNTALPTLAELENANEFQARHLGPWDEEQAQMLSVVGVASRRSAHRRHRAGQHQAHGTRWTCPRQ